MSLLRTPRPVEVVLDDSTAAQPLLVPGKAPRSLRGSAWAGVAAAALLLVGLAAIGRPAVTEVKGPTRVAPVPRSVAQDDATPVNHPATKDREERRPKPHRRRPVRRPVRPRRPRTATRRTPVSPPPVLVAPRPQPRVAPTAGTPAPAAAAPAPPPAKQATPATPEFF